MSKFGVGVGDDFPVDDGRGNEGRGDQGQEPPRDDSAEFEEWKRRRQAHRAQREEWQRQKDEWRAAKRAFKERVKQAARESFGREWEKHQDDPRYYNGGYRRSRFPFVLWPVVGLMIPILIVAILISLVAAIFKSPFVFLALVLLAFLIFGYRHNHHRHEFDGPFRGSYHGPRDYDFDLKPSNGPTPPGNNGGTIVTPPPAPPAAPTGK